MEAKIRPLEQLSFSSQYYFVAYLSLTGNLWTIIGMLTILQSGFNPYNDFLMIFIIFLNQLIMIAIEKLFLFLRKKLKIWDVKTNQVHPTVNLEKKRENYETNQSFLPGELNQPKDHEPGEESIEVKEEKTDKKVIILSKLNTSKNHSIKRSRTVAKEENEIEGMYDKFKE